MSSALGLIGILITHRVAGPLYVMFSYVNTLAEGRYPTFRSLRRSFFFFTDTATTEIYTLSLHDALPICHSARTGAPSRDPGAHTLVCQPVNSDRSEEHTSELQSRSDLVCRLLLEKKKNKKKDKSRKQQRKNKQKQKKK